MDDGSSQTGSTRLPWEDPVITDSRVHGVTRSGTVEIAEGEDGDDLSVGTPS